MQHVPLKKHASKDNGKGLVLHVPFGRNCRENTGHYQAHNCIFNYIDKNVLFYDEVSGLTINAGDKACAFLVLSVEYKPRLVLTVKCVDLNSFYFFEYANFFDLLEPVWRHERKPRLQLS